MSDISVVMGSKSDWPTVKETCDILDEFGVSYEKNVISAHRCQMKCSRLRKMRLIMGLK
jgi:phosphoribosylcarboxyaminoimidazole (NCAIR) mutase